MGEKLNHEIQIASASPMFSPLVRQILAASGPLVTVIGSGVTMGYSAILLPQLEEGNSTIKITTDQGSWIASMAALSMAIGSIVSGILCDRLGRKLPQIMGSLIYTVGVILIGVAQNIEMVLAGRFLTGFCLGFVLPPAIVYIGETSAPKYRGFLLSAVAFVTSVGIFLSHITGIFLTWKVIALSSLLLPCVSIVLILVVPESPTWLTTQGRVEEAQKAFVWFRGHESEACNELATMLEKQKLIGQKEKVTWAQCGNVRFLKLLVVMNVFVCTMQFAGVNAIAFYAVSMMKDAVGGGKDQYLTMILVDTVRLIMSVVACVLVRSFGRRPLLNISVFATATSLFGLSGFLYVSKIYPEIGSYSFIPIGCLVSYMVFVNVGLVPLPGTMLGEVFPRNLKDIGNAITWAVNFIVLFLVIKINPAMTLYLQPCGIFLFYGCATTMGGIILYFYLPETKGKTLQEIEERFNNEKHELVSVMSNKLLIN